MIRRKVYLTLLVLTGIILVATSALAMPARMARGKPVGAKGPRYELWHDPLGWHLRWTGAGGAHHFQGRVHVVGGSIALLEKISKEPDDRIWKTPRTIHIDAFSGGGFDGFDFRWDGPELIIELTIDGISRPKRIFIGSSLAHPRTYPFSIHRNTPPKKRGKVWVPGHYGPRGRWIPGHWR